MPRAINLRQVEVFKALMEHGTVSRAAEAVNVSQPAASKLLMQLERDGGLALFDRARGRLTPTAQGRRLYEEIDRIFAGMRQVETAIAVIRREDQGRLAVGVMPALAGEFISAATMGFLRRHPKTYCSIRTLRSTLIAEGVLTRKLDVGLISSRVDNPYLATEKLLEQPLVCVMPLGHPLARRKAVCPAQLGGVPFISFDAASHTAQTVARVFGRHGATLNAVLMADVNPTVCQFVAAGLGVSLVHPLFIAGMEDRLVVRPFEPATPMDFLLCFARDAKDTPLVADFVAETKALAARMTRDLRRSLA